LLFVVETKHRANMDFEKFLNILPKLAMLVYQSENRPPKEALLDLLSGYFTPLYSRIMENTHIGSAKKLLTDGLDTNSLELLWNVQDILRKVYSFHFPEEYFKEDDYTNLEILKNLSQKKFFKFCKEFNVIPSMIGKGQGLTLFNEIINVPLTNLYSQNVLEDNSQDNGWIWTFSRFLFFLLKINDITFSESERSQQVGRAPGSPADNLTLILNQLQGSKGFVKFRQTLGANNSMISLLPSNTISSSLKKSFQSLGILSVSDRKNFLDRSNSFLKNSTIRSLYKQEHLDNMSTLSMLSSHTKRLRSVSKNKVLEKEILYCEDLIPIFEEYTDDLVAVFEGYATLGEPMNTEKLKSIKFHRLLREADILMKGNSLTQNPREYRKETQMILNVSTGSSDVQKRYLSPIEADFIFVQLTGSKFRKDCNSRNTSWNRRVQSPNIKKPSYIGKKTAVTKTIDNKLEFATFLKAIEMIALKLYPELDIQSAVKIIIEKITRLRNSNKIEARTMGLHQITHLKELLTNQNLMKICPNCTKTLKFTSNFTPIPEIASI